MARLHTIAFRTVFAILVLVPLLALAKLTLKAGVLTLAATRADADLLLGEQTRKRLTGLADCLGASARVVAE